MPYVMFFPVNPQIPCGPKLSAVIDEILWGLVAEVLKHRRLTTPPRN